nr:PREDICTED: uncharacterized protein LOC100875203 isoform X2 [Megachile rotundata]
MSCGDGEVYSDGHYLLVRFEEEDVDGDYLSRSDLEELYLERFMRSAVGCDDCPDFVEFVVGGEWGYDAQRVSRVTKARVWDCVAQSGSDGRDIKLCSKLSVVLSSALQQPIESKNLALHKKCCCKKGGHKFFITLRLPYAYSSIREDIASYFIDCLQVCVGREKDQSLHTGKTHRKLIKSYVLFMVTKP